MEKVKVDDLVVQYKISSDKSYLPIKVREGRIVKEVKRNDSL